MVFLTNDVMAFDIALFGLLTPVRRGRRCTLHPNIMGDIAVDYFCPNPPIGNQGAEMQLRW
jgi:hypothetical protein